jgi:hypothetical protein
MDSIAHRLTKLSLWGLPLLWLALAVFVWLRHSWLAGACFAIAGLSGLLWNLFFLPIGVGRPAEIWRAMVFVEYDEAPLGHVLSVYLPLLSKLSLVAAVSMLAFKRAV